MMDLDDVTTGSPAGGSETVGVFNFALSPLASTLITSQGATMGDGFNSQAPIIPHATRDVTTQI